MPSRRAVKVAEPVASVGLLPKEAGYKAYYAESAVASLLRGPVPLVMVNNISVQLTFAIASHTYGKFRSFMAATQILPLSTIYILYSLRSR